MRVSSSASAGVIDGSVSGARCGTSSIVAAKNALDLQNELKTFSAHAAPSRIASRTTVDTVRRSFELGHDAVNQQRLTLSSIAHTLLAAQRRLGPAAAAVARAR